MALGSPGTGQRVIGSPLSALALLFGGGVIRPNPAFQPIFNFGEKMKRDC